MLCLKPLVISALLFFISGATQAQWQQEWVALEGELIQGAMVVGVIPKEAQLWIEDRKVRVTDGRFVFGLGRDAAATVKLRSVYQDKDLTWQIPVKEREYNIQRINGIAKKYMAPSEEALNRIRDDNRQVGQARKKNLATEFYRETFVWPVKGAITGVYGSQRIFNGEPRRPHFGIDIAAAKGTPVKAPASGEVTLAHPDMYYSGATMVLDHGHGISSTFLHMDSFAVEEGQQVEQGQVLGYVGSTGRSTGAHLDWRVNWFNQRLDPASIAGPMPE